MLQLFTEHLEQIRAEAIDAFPEEAAWVITEKGCWKTVNTADEPEKFFDISASEMRKARGQGLLAIVHSHTNGNHFPSEMDMTYQVNTAVPWGILTSDGVGASAIRWWGGTDPATIEDLNDRTFCHGTSDCYALVRDYYILKLGITLPEFPRAWRWWDTQDLLREGFAKAGFSVVSEPREHDVWLAAFGRSGRLNHCGVYIGNELTQHHPGADDPVNATKKAVVTPIYRYLQHVQLWVRHKDLA
jgi:proteasome lid subunit RPN8/RPN11